eukprot:9644995-Alexandrium_andersonii.AAC.1
MLRARPPLGAAPAARLSLHHRAALRGRGSQAIRGDGLRRKVIQGAERPLELLSVLTAGALHEVHVLEGPEHVRAPVRVGARLLRCRRWL